MDSDQLINYEQDATERELRRLGFAQDDSLRAWVVRNSHGDTILAIGNRVVSHMDCVDVSTKVPYCQMVMLRGGFWDGVEVTLWGLEPEICIVHPTISNRPRVPKGNEPYETYIRMSPTEAVTKEIRDDRSTERVR